MAENTFSKKYENELQGQVDFLQTYLPRVDSSLDISDVQRDYNDGVVRGNLIEFKTMIENLNMVLSQAIKYLSSMRIKGRPVPANIVLVSLNNTTAYVYHSADYLDDIEKVYSGAASRNNEKFVAGDCICKIDYSNPKEESDLIGTLRTNNYTKIHINEDCIVGWANFYYKQYPNETKASFIGDETGKTQIIGEIRNPTRFRDYIYPYKGKSNERFRYLMDRLNDDLHKKNLGAFYTHPVYAEKSLELVRKAIARVPKGNDYIIIDRCAGTGNLEACMTDEELSHTIVSTYEYYEYKVLAETLGNKVKEIIPPTEKTDTFNGGMVRGANALSIEYVENEIIKVPCNLGRVDGEMVVQRRHLEQSVRVTMTFHIPHLQDDRQLLNEEDTAQQGNEPLLADEHGEHSDDTAQAQAVRVAHEHLGRIGIIPQETYCRADECCGINHQFAAIWDVHDIQVG